MTGPTLDEVMRDPGVIDHSAADSRDLPMCCELGIRRRLTRTAPDGAHLGLRDGSRASFARGFDPRWLHP